MHLVLVSLFATLAALPVAFAMPYCGLVPPKPQPRSVAQSSGGNTTNGGNSSSPDQVLATGWYPGWLGAALAPSNISWSKYNALTFAFAVTTNDPSNISLDAQSATLLPEFVTEAGNNGVSALLSIGGWTGSQYFSTAVGNAANRSAFVTAVTGLATKYNLDGIDFDWEYPNRQGIGCNTISPSDSSNFLAFLQQLKQDPVGSKLILSAAVGETPFMGANGTPMTDVSAFADVLDHIAIMNYDVWGSFSPTVGPNSPLDDSCAPTKAGSAVSAVKAWTGANFPANQIALGVAAYGHSFHVTTSAALGSSGNLNLYPSFDKSQQPLGDSDTSTSASVLDSCGQPEGISGTFNFNGMVAYGFLNSNGTAANGIDYTFDNCSQTPFVYNTTAQTMISYDDARSFAAKGNFISSNGLLGFAVWHVAGDYNDILLGAISDAMGIVQICS